MPYPNFHSCRLNDPGKYKKIRYKKQGGADVVMGQKESGDWEVQAIRYPKGSFSAEEAQKSCRSHGGSFEAAKHSWDSSTIEEWPAAEPLPECFNVLKFAKKLSNQEIFAVGKWNGERFSEADLDSMVSAFHSLKGKFDVPIKLGHDEAQRWWGQADGVPALGWVSNVKRINDKLVGDFEDVPDAIYTMIQNRNYRKKSAEIYINLESDGQKWPRALKAVSLLGVDPPAVTTLNDLQALFMSDGQSSSGSYTITTWSDSDGSGREPEWVWYKMDQEDDMNAEQEKVFKDQISALEGKLKDETKRADDAEAKAVQAEAQLAERDEKFAVEQFVVKVDSFIKEGKVLPSEKEGLERQFVALGSGTKKYKDKDYNPREELVKTLEARSIKFKFNHEHAIGGESEGGDVPAAIQIDRKAKQFQKEFKFTYEDGLQKVKTEEPIFGGNTSLSQREEKDNGYL